MGQTQRISKNNTTVKRDKDGWTVCTLHSTDVIKVKDGLAVLNSGGWKTVTTKARINQACNEWGLPFGVTQKDFSWTVRMNDGKEVPFADGMEVTF